VGGRATVIREGTEAAGIHTISAPFISPFTLPASTFLSKSQKDICKHSAAARTVAEG